MNQHVLIKEQMEDNYIGQILDAKEMRLGCPI